MASRGGRYIYVAATIKWQKSGELGYRINYRYLGFISAEILKDTLPLERKW
jgi:hypothetical protein